MRYELVLWHLECCCCFVVVVCLVPVVIRFSASEMCVSWGGASVRGCSACLPVPHSSSTRSHSHRFRGEESIHTSPAHSDPVVHSPRRSESLGSQQSRTRKNKFTHQLIFWLKHVFVPTIIIFHIFFWFTAWEFHEILLLSFLNSWFLVSLSLARS